MNAVPPPGNEPCGGVRVRARLAGQRGSELGSHRFIENQGAMVSSKLWVDVVPGRRTVGSRCGSTGSRSTQVTSLPEPGREERNRSDGSSWPM